MSTATQQYAENHLSKFEARWFAVYTHFKREKVVAKRLASKGIEYFLPLQKRTRRYTRKIKEVELPLINCYIFVKITKPEYVPVLETDDVLKFVRFRKNLISIPEEEIDILRLVVGENIEVEVEAGSLNVGDEVEIVGGHLTGLRGTLHEQRSDKNFVVALDKLGYSLLMQLDPQLLRRIGPGASKPQREDEHNGRFRDFV
jgi:transcription antitermination factor NusG